MSNFREHTNHFIPFTNRLRKVALFLVAFLIVEHPSFGAEQAATQNAEAVILMYHRFDDIRHPSTNTSLNDLRRHIQVIADIGRSIVPLSEIVKALNGGDPLPQNTTALTIDDAYRSVYDIAWPFLRDNNIPFTLFVATEPVAQRQTDYMTPEHLREMAAHPGVTIASHGHTHNSLAFANEKTVTDELQTANALLSEWLGITPPPIFAFPYGEAGSTALNAAETFGFSAAFGQHSGGVGIYQNRFYLPRFPMSGRFANESRLRESLSTLPLPHENFAPTNPAVSATSPPEFVEFTLTERLSTDRLSCFSDGENLEITAKGARVRITFPPDAAPPRWRINCTHPAPDGRWYWLGWQAAIEAASRN